jgi:hypothetical protein
LPYRSLGSGCYQITSTNEHTFCIVNRPLNNYKVFTPIDCHEEVIKCVQVVRECLANSWVIVDLAGNELQLDNTVCALITYMNNNNMK